MDKNLIFPKVEIFDNIKDGRIYRTVTTSQEVLPVNCNIPYQISMIDGYASLYDGRYGQMVRIANFSYPALKIESYPRVVFQTETNSNIIDLLGVKYILSLSKLTNPKYKFIAQEGRSSLYENLKVFPKAFLVGSYSVTRNDLETVNKMLSTDLEKEVILEEKPKIEENLKSFEVGKVDLIDYEENEVVLKVSSPVPSMLVLTDAYDLGWKATIDNVYSKVYRANYDLRAVGVPLGEHEIVFRYWPNSFTIGIYIFIFTLTSLLLFCVLFMVKNCPFSKRN